MGVGLLGLVLMACQGGRESSEQAAVAASSVPNANGQASEPVLDSGDAPPTVGTNASPEDDRDGLRLLIFGQTIEAQKSLYEKAEPRIQECMASAGFQYPAVPFVSDAFIPLQPYELGPEEEVDRLGYRNATLMVQREIAAAVSSLEASQNPLASYVDSLPGASRLEFFTALLGPPGDGNSLTPGAPDGDFVPANANGGCRGKAYSESTTPAEDRTSWPPDMLREFSNIQTVVAADASFLQAQVAWQACMAANGYPVASRAAAKELASSQVPVDGMTSTSATLSDGQTVSVEIPNFKIDALQAAIAKEISIAKADLQCSRDSRMDVVRAEVELKLEKSFLDRWVAVLGPPG